MEVGNPAQVVPKSVRMNIQALMLWAAPLLFLTFFFFFPLGSVFSYAFSGQAGELVVNPATIWRPLRFTILQATLSTLLTLVVGFPSAYLFAHYTFPGKRLLWVITTLPFILPTVVVAAAFNALLGPRGLLNIALMNGFNLEDPPLQLLNTLAVILIAHVFYNASIVIRMVTTAWVHLDPRLIQAARALGANPWQAFTEVTLPLLRPTLYAAALLVFLFDFTSFGVVLLLGGPRYATLEVEIYTQALHMLNLPVASLLSVLQLGLTLGLTTVYARLNRGTIVPVASQGSPAKTIERKNLRKWMVLPVLAISALLFFGAPLAALTARSVTRLEAARGERGEVQPGLTFSYYQELFINRRGSIFYVPPITAMRNSLLYAAGAVGISLGLGFLAATALTKTAWVNRVLDPLFMLPLGASAVTLGFGFILVFNRPPMDLRTFPLLLPIAHSLVALPIVVRSLQPALGAIPPQLRQAAATLGANPFRVWREVDLPIVTRAALVGATFAFTISLGEFGATTFLARPEYPTMPIAIFRYLSQPGALNFGQAMAMATLLMLVCAAGMLVIEALQDFGFKKD